MDTNYIIETKNLTKQYGSQKSVADLNIHVNHYHENAVGLNEADFRGGQNLGETLAGE